jgi:hypothetical protein
MNRRNPNARVGFVNFPIETIQSSGEGGQIVRLVVLDTIADLGGTEQFIPCCGGMSLFYYDECFLGDDLPEEQYDAGPEPDYDADPAVWLARYTKLSAHEDRIRRTRNERYFPSLNDNVKPGDVHYEHKYQSIAVLASILLGATGWSSGTWKCSYNDLTEDGRAYYDLTQKLYPGCELRLLTFLDT